jgi:hypothetical protein
VAGLKDERMNGNSWGAAGGARLWGAWTVSCAAGELIGLAAAAGIAAVVNRTVGEPVGWAALLAALAATALAGVVEGSSIAWFQWRILRRRWPRLPFGPWLYATVGVALLAWALGTGASLLAATGSSDQQGPEPPLGVIALVSAAFGMLAGTLFGGAQWLVLRRRVDRAARWIVGNAIGWAIALPWISVAAALPSERTAAAWIVTLGAGAGIVAGLSVGAITGVFLLRMQPRSHLAP